MLEQMLLPQQAQKYATSDRLVLTRQKLQVQILLARAVCPAALRERESH